jgi:hypothetical protein
VFKSSLIVPTLKGSDLFCITRRIEKQCLLCSAMVQLWEQLVTGRERLSVRAKERYGQSLALS